MTREALSYQPKGIIFILLRESYSKAAENDWHDLDKIKDERAIGNGTNVVE